LQLNLDPPLVARFARDLDPLISPDARVGIAVSGGPDSLALLLLAASARPGKVEAATVDHGLRGDSAREAELVNQICLGLNISHQTLRAEWEELPSTALQERARAERYRLLGRWIDERRLDALATGHHLDDQAETLLMRLSRGSGVRGLAAMRPLGAIPGSTRRLIRPVLGWRRSELGSVCEAAGLTGVQDPSNDDERFERVRVRNALAALDWLDVTALGRSAANLADADRALEWAVEQHWEAAVSARENELRYAPQSAPPEIRRRIVSKLIARLASEGVADLRARELDRVMEALEAGETATLRGVRCEGGEEWTFAPAPTRRS
jgi:tRNA(Ile)-lysidine synthase